MPLASIAVVAFALWVGADEHVAVLTEDTVRTALQRDAATNLIAEISYTKEIWLEDPSASAPYSLQEWRLYTDGKGGVRAELSRPTSPTKLRFIAVDSQSTSWLSGINNEVVVLDKIDAPDLPSDSDMKARVHVMQSLVRQAQTETQWLLGPQITATQSVNVALLDRNEAQPGAIVSVDGETRSYTFERNQDELLVHSVLRDAEGQTRKWTYLDYQRLGSRWFPRIAEFRETNSQGQTNRLRYSDISVRAYESVAEVDRYFRLPSPGDADFQSARVVRTLSGRFANSPLAIEAVPNLPRFLQLRSDDESRR